MTEGKYPFGQHDPSIGWEFGNPVTFEIHDNVLKIDMMVLLVLQ